MCVPGRQVLTQKYWHQTDDYHFKAPFAHCHATKGIIPQKPTSQGSVLANSAKVEWQQLMKSELAEVEKYPVITPKGLTSPEAVIRLYVTALVCSVLLWLFYSMCIYYIVEIQICCMVGCLIYHIARHGPKSANFERSTLELKAKGLDIKDPSLNAIMAWDWLKKVEIRQRSLSIIPNYVYFKFSDTSDVLILWEDVRDTMDSTTLISCVRTWAPHAEVIGDAQLAKSESIATYTELWLKEMSSTKAERRLRQDQILSEGTILSESYKIERVLSGGGQGTAYLASVLPNADVPEMPPQVVIKEFILPANDRGLQKATDKLFKEVAILRRISHPRIVYLYDSFIEDMRGYLAIEFVDGITLRQMIVKNGPQAEAWVAKIGVSLCEALSYLHQLSPPIIHGDVTPENIMIEQSGNLKLMDFDASQELTRNKTNTVVGKHAYMSPEQFKGLLGESSDIYALGCTLHFLLTGVDPEPISESCPVNLIPTISEGMNKIIARATKLDRAERFSNLNEMRAQLERL